MCNPAAAHFYGGYICHRVQEMTPMYLIVHKGIFTECWIDNINGQVMLCRNVLCVSTALCGLGSEKKIYIGRDRHSPNLKKRNDTLRRARLRHSSSRVSWDELKHK